MSVFIRHSAGFEKSRTEGNYSHHEAEEKETSVFVAATTQVEVPENIRSVYLDYRHMGRYLIQIQLIFTCEGGLILT